MDSDKIKQTIIIRRDLKMRRGKEIAQGSHASMAFLEAKYASGNLQLSEIEKEWLLGGKQTKVTLQIHSEAELRQIADQAQSSGVQCHMIIDSGRTEFNGEPTLTCLALGPEWSSKIDPITKDLKIY